MADEVQRGTPHRVRLDALFASDAPVAVILRRGPKRFYRLIKWDLDTDTFELGQWMVGEVGLSDLSPDGTKLLYWAHQYGGARRSGPASETSGTDSAYEPLEAPQPKRRKARRVPRYQRVAAGQVSRRQVRGPRAIGDTWTAISTPPYFSALAVWAAKDRYQIGGLFLPDGAVLLPLPEDQLTPHYNVEPKRRLRSESWYSETHFRQVRSTSAISPGYGDIACHELTYVRGLREAGAKWVEWVFLREGDGMCLFACDGCIYRLPQADKVPVAEWREKAKVLADLNGQTFATIAPPREALTW